MRVTQCEGDLGRSPGARTGQRRARASSHSANGSQMRSVSAFACT